MTHELHIADGCASEIMALLKSASDQLSLNISPRLIPVQSGNKERAKMRTALNTGC